MEIRLISPAAQHEEAVMEYRQEFIDNGDSMDGTANLRGAESYAQWLAALSDNSSESTVREGLVCASTFLAVDEDGRLVGMADIRHRLNDHLLAFGGHIGYSVRKSERRKGYAKRILALSLEKCASLGIARVLVTCDSENEASMKTIRANGGVLENSVVEEGRLTNRYWITL